MPLRFAAGQPGRSDELSSSLSRSRRHHHRLRQVRRKRNMNERLSSHGRLVFSLCVLLTAVFPAYSQSTTSLRGTVTNIQDGVVPDAVVTLNDQEKGATRQGVTDAVG